MYVKTHHDGIAATATTTVDNNTYLVEALLRAAHLHDAPLAVLAGHWEAVDQALWLAIAAVAVHTHADPAALRGAQHPVAHMITGAAGG